MDVLVAGGTGFIGRALCRELDERRHTVTALSRSATSSGLPASVSTVAGDVTRPDLVGAVEGHDAVVNLVALPSHVSMDRTHTTVHRDGTANLVAASEEAGVDRFVQMSALGVDDDVDTAYFRAKRDAESVVRESTLEWVVVRPSVVFGDGCAFLPFLERVVPPLVAPLPKGGRTRIHPIWVGDLAPVLADCVDGDHARSVYEIGGSEALTLAETVREVCGTRRIVALPDPLAAAGFSIAELVPGIPFDRDQYRAFGLDNTTPENDVTVFGLDPDDLRTLQDYLAEQR